MARVPATIRQATADDLANVVELIRVGDDRPYLDGNVERFIRRLDPDYAQAWLAVAGDQPVGMSMIYQRALRAGEHRYTTGYWANLYIDPDHRDQMLYPRLPIATFDSVKRGELDFVYALVRRQNLIEAHQRIGAAKIADLPVLIKPLRPALFMSKYKHLPHPLRALARPADALFGAYLRLRRPHPSADLTLDVVPWDSDELADLAALLNETRGGRVARHWTVESLRARYAVSLDGDPYTLLMVRRAGQPTASVIHRWTDRDHDLRVGVVMDLAYRAGCEDDARIALAETERHAHAAGAEAVMFLDGLGESARAMVTRAGYMRSPEIFTLVIWPKTILTDGSILAGVADWRLAFGDHDAF